MTTRAAHPEWRYKTKKKWTPRRWAWPARPATQALTAVNRQNSESDELLRAMVDLCVSSVAVLDETGVTLYASRAWNLAERENGPGTSSRNDEPYIFQCPRVTPSEDDEEANILLGDDIQRVLSGQEKEFHHEYYDARAEQLPFLVHSARLTLRDSFRVLVTHENIPRNRDYETSHDDRLSELLATTNIMVWEGEVKAQRFSYVSDAAIGMLGYPQATWYEPNFLASHIHPDDREQVLTAYRKKTETKEHFDLTFRMVASDGRVIWVQNLVSVLHEHGRAKRMHGFMIDVSVRKRAEHYQKDLGGRLIAAQEEERKRVARELHDDFNQRLAVLGIELEQLGQQIPNPLRRKVHKIQAQAKEISAEIHQLSYQLHPSKLDHLGLCAALASLCNEVSESSKIKIEFRHTGFPSTLEKDITLCLFRIAQEGLRNCVKYSGAESARVLLTKTQNAIRMSVSDNGCGFDASPEVMEKGLGFISMKERLYVLGGELKVYSSPLRGTRIEVMVPLGTRDC